MEVLQALVLKANLDAGNAEPSPVLAKVKLLSKVYCKSMSVNNLMWPSQVKDVCSATLEEGHKHGIVRTPQEEGEALGREEVKSIVSYFSSLNLSAKIKDQQSSTRSSLNLGDEHQLLEGASKLFNKKYLLSTH